MSNLGIKLESIASQMGALSCFNQDKIGKPIYKVSCDKLVKSLMRRFKADRYDVEYVIQRAIKANVLYEENGKYCLKYD